MPNIDEAIEALLSYQQADMEGVIVLTSRQAIHEVADELRRMRAVAQRPKPYPELLMSREALKAMLSLFDDEGNMIATFVEMQNAINDGYDVLSYTRPDYSVASAQCSLPLEPTPAMREAAAYYLGAVDIGPVWRAMVATLPDNDALAEIRALIEDGKLTGEYLIGAIKNIAEKGPVNRRAAPGVLCWNCGVVSPVNEPQAALEQVKSYVERSIASFTRDHADSDFQRGFLAALEVVRDEAFSVPRAAGASPMTRPHRREGDEV